MSSTTQRSTGIKPEIVKRAHALGFDTIRVTHPEALEKSGARLQASIDENHHGDMDWMQTTLNRRSDPKSLMPDVQSIIIAGMSYAPKADPLDALDDKNGAVISVYAQGRDYHNVLKGRLKEIAGLIHARTGADVKVFVDTAPLMEKPLAAAAGIGWQGKHTNLVSREHGSWLFLGAILTSAELPTDAPAKDSCGSCTRCLDICPTDAFPAPYRLDARRCIAYLTNEYQGHIPLEFRDPIQNRVFGCDDCLAVCPWNKFAKATRETSFHATVQTKNPPIRELLELGDAAFRKRFAQTPVKRTGRDRFLRNVLIAAGNSADPTLTSRVETHLTDDSPLVRAMAVWAISKLVDRPKFGNLKAHYLPRESDVDVKGEWSRMNAP